MSWGRLVTALDKATGMSAQQNPQRPRRSGANAPPNQPPRVMNTSAAAHFGLPVTATNIDPSPDYHGPRNRSKSEEERDEEEAAREAEEEANVAAAAGAGSGRNSSRHGEGFGRHPADGGTSSRGDNYDDMYSEEDDPEGTVVHSPLLEKLASGLRNHLDKDIANTYYKELKYAPQYQKDDLLAILLTMLGDRFTASPSPSGRPPPGPEATSVGTVSQIDRALERLDGLEIRVLSLQKTVGHSSTDPLSQQPGTSVGFGGNLPFGMPAATPNLSTAFSMYGSKATTMQGAKEDPGAQTESQQELRDRLAKMGL